MHRVGPSNQPLSHTPTIAEALTAFADRSHRNLQPATAILHKQAATALTHFLLDNTNLHLNIDSASSLTIEILHAFLSYLQNTYSPETEHAYSRAVAAFTSTLPSNTTQSLNSQFTDLIHSIRRKKPRHQPSIPSSDRIATIRDYLYQYPIPEANDKSSPSRQRLRILRDKALIFTMLDTGLRPSEIAALHTSDCQPTHIILQGISMMIPPQTIHAIQRYLSERAPLDQNQAPAISASLPLFARHDKRAGRRILPVSRWTIANIITHWTHLAPPPSVPDQTDAINPTVLRHHFVMSILTDTNDLALTQQRARHKDRATTRNYLEHSQPTDTD